jgi:hypothetical protein
MSKTKFLSSYTTKVALCIAKLSVKACNQCGEMFKPAEAGALLSRCAGCWDYASDGEVTLSDNPDRDSIIAAVDFRYHGATYGN